MLRKFLSHWQYGIKARVVDNALVAKIDTAAQPTFVRLDLDKIGSATITVQNRDTDYELAFVQSRAESTPVARFEVREAAEVAQRQIACALYRGSPSGRFRRAFATTIGILVALLLFGAVVTGITSLTSPPAGVGPMIAGQGVVPPELANIQELNKAFGNLPADPSGRTETQGVPMSADDFLNK
ncbi:MAG: hypothetical protein AB7G06_00045 [Bdellovibrionales bacterium]